MIDDTTKPIDAGADNTIAPDSAQGEEHVGWVNLSGDQFEAGLRRYDDTCHADLRWAYHYYIASRRLSYSAIGDELGIDTSTVSRVLRGIYPAQFPPSRMLSQIRILRQQEINKARQRGQGRIKTPVVVDGIWNVCRKVWADKLIGMIFGPIHVGKTEALKWFKDENNHGATIYIDLQGITGVQELYREFARALMISPNCPMAKLKPRVMETIRETTLVIVDEYHYITYAYLRGSSKRMVSELKSIHDRCKCGMVICMTDVGRADFESGPEHKLCEQLWRRGTIKLQLPDAIPVADVRAIVKAYGLHMPEGPKTETWMQFRTAHTDFAPCGILEDIARNQGIQSLITTLKDGNIIASKQSRELRWDDVMAVQSIYADQLKPKHA